MKNAVPKMLIPVPARARSRMLYFIQLLLLFCVSDGSERHAHLESISFIADVMARGWNEQHDSTRPKW
jgi:hypothetical protein